MCFPDGHLIRSFYFRFSGHLTGKWCNLKFMVCHFHSLRLPLSLCLALHILKSSLLFYIIVYIYKQAFFKYFIFYWAIFFNIYHVIKTNNFIKKYLSKQRLWNNDTMMVRTASTDEWGFSKPLCNHTRDYTWVNT